MKMIEHYVVIKIVLLKNIYNYIVNKPSKIKLNEINKVILALKFK